MATNEPLTESKKMKEIEEMIIPPKYVVYGSILRLEVRLKKRPVSELIARADIYNEFYSEMKKTSLWKAKEPKIVALLEYYGKQGILNYGVASSLSSEAVKKLGLMHLQNYTSSDATKMGWSIEKFIELFTGAAIKGDAHAAYVLGREYLCGNNLERNTEKGIHLLIKATELGYIPAFFYLGETYQKGLHCKEDIVKAKEWYQKAALKGDDKARIALKNLQENIPDDYLFVSKFENGKLITDSKELAVSKSTVQASSENTISLVKTVSQLQNSAKEGNADACMLIIKMRKEKGEDYLRQAGLTIETDYELYKRAAELGLIEAQVCLGEMFENVYHQYARLNLLKEYFQGKQAEYFGIQAQFWYQKAIDQGSRVACDNLVKMHQAYFSLPNKNIWSIEKAKELSEITTILEESLLKDKTARPGEISGHMQERGSVLLMASAVSTTGKSAASREEEDSWCTMTDDEITEARDRTKEEERKSKAARNRKL